MWCREVRRAAGRITMSRDRPHATDMGPAHMRENVCQSSTVGFGSNLISSGFETYERRAGDITVFHVHSGRGGSVVVSRPCVRRTPTGELYVKRIALLEFGSVSLM